MASVSTYDFLGLLHTSLELGDVPLRLIFRQLVDLILSDDTQRLLCVEFPLTNMSCIDGASGGHWGSREGVLSKASGSRASPRKAEARWLTTRAQSGGERVASSSSAPRRVEAAQNGCRKTRRAVYEKKRWCGKDLGMVCGGVGWICGGVSAVG